MAFRCSRVIARKLSGKRGRNSVFGGLGGCGLGVLGTTGILGSRGTED